MIASRFRSCLVLIGLTAFGSTAMAQAVDHPAYTSWARQPLGTRIVLRSRTVSDANTITTTTETILKKKTPELVSLEIRRVSDATGKTVATPEETYDQRRLFPLMGGMKKEDIGKPNGAIDQGVETLELAGRPIKAVWYDGKTKGDGNLDWLTRTWISDEVPGRLVKSVTNIPKAGTTVTVELTEWETPKP